MMSKSIIVLSNSYDNLCWEMTIRTSDCVGSRRVLSGRVGVRRGKPTIAKASDRTTTAQPPWVPVAATFGDGGDSGLILRAEMVFNGVFDSLEANLVLIDLGLHAVKLLFATLTLEQQL